MVAFDAATAVAEFIAETDRTSLELPHLTTGQRKHVKTLLQQYPDLCCESYGFGADRRLHIFKKGCMPESKLEDSSTIVHEQRFQLPVRNTFIQYDEKADDRAVQSMPHGMFRQSILAEARPKASAPETEATTSTVPASEPEADPTACPPAAQGQSGQCTPLGIGALVVVEGLTKLPAFNGLSAVVQGWDAASGRYDIMIVSTNGGCQQAKVKRENLRLLLPCPDASP